MTIAELSEAFDSPPPELMSIQQAAGLAKALRKIRQDKHALESDEQTVGRLLRAWFKARPGEVIQVEGQPDLSLKERNGKRSWDVKSMQESDPVLFARLLELGCLTVNGTVLDAQAQAGAVTGFKRFEHRGMMEVLAFDE
jgi:hypothetical protein